MCASALALDLHTRSLNYRPDVLSFFCIHTHLLLDLISTPYSLAIAKIPCRIGKSDLSKADTADHISALACRSIRSASLAQAHDIRCVETISKHRARVRSALDGF